MHPLGYTLYKILDDKKLHAFIFHGRSQTIHIYTHQYSRIFSTISTYIFHNNHSHSRIQELALLSNHTWRKPQKEKRLISKRNYPLNIFLEQTLSKRLGSLCALNKPWRKHNGGQRTVFDHQSDKPAKALTRASRRFTFSRRGGKKSIESTVITIRDFYVRADGCVAAMKGRRRALRWERAVRVQLIGPRRKRRRWRKGVGRGSKSTVNMRDKRFSLRGKRTFDVACTERAKRKFSPGKILDAVWLHARKLLAGIDSFPTAFFFLFFLLFRFDDIRRINRSLFSLYFYSYSIHFRFRFHK